MYLSFSGFKRYVTCPRSYWYQYIDKTALILPENRVNSIYGSTVGRLFELFYNEQIWKRSDTVNILLGMVESELDQIIRKEEKVGVVDWTDEKANYSSKDQLMTDIRDAIPRGIATIRTHRLIGRDAKAEVKLDTEIEGYMIGGRADFVMTRVSPHDDLIILDGKGSRHREAFVDDRQLTWYALLYRLKFNRTPDKLGFVFWRSEPEKSVDWVAVSDQSCNKMQEMILQYTRQIEEGTEKLSKGSDEVRRLAMLEEFQAQPGDKCRLCSYKPLCPDGQNFTSKSHQIPVTPGVGVEDVGLDV